MRCRRAGHTILNGMQQHDSWRHFPWKIVLISKGWCGIEWKMVSMQIVLKMNTANPVWANSRHPLRHLWTGTSCGRGQASWVKYSNSKDCVTACFLKYGIIAGLRGKIFCHLWLWGPVLWERLVPRLLLLISYLRSLCSVTEKWKNCLQLKTSLSC